MKSILLPGTGRSTSQLGFGCAYLTPETAAALDVAYSLGIRHFDVARSYGRGLTEGLLRKFLRKTAADVSVTSKYGIVPPFGNPAHELARRLLKPVIRRLRRSPRMDRGLNAIPALHTRKASFRGPDAMASLRTSLRNLGLARLDVFLMHEAEPGDLGDPELEDSLRRLRQAGDIGAFGVGGRACHVPRLLAERPGFCDVLQYEWTPVEPVPEHAPSFDIHYRVYGGPVRDFQTMLARDAVLRRRWSDEIDRDLERPGTVESLMLNAAVSLRPHSIILFSSTRAEHIEKNVSVATDARSTPVAMRLVQLMSEYRRIEGAGP